MDGYRDQFTVPYLDDLLIDSATFEQHLKHLRLVLQRLKRHGIRVKASKCHLFKCEISYLGRIISSAGYTTDPKNIIVVSPKLKTKPFFITELRSILGLVGYFRRSIPNFSQTASAQYHILCDTQNKQRQSEEPIDWNDNHQAALDKLLHHLVTPPILAFPDYDQPFKLLADASRLGLGCSLFQMQNGKLRVLGFVRYRKKIPQLQVGIPSPEVSNA